MTTVHRFEDLVMFRKARELTREVYKALSGCRDGGFRDQIHPVRSSPPRRPFGRASAGATSNGVHAIAKASAGEVRAQTYVGHDVGYLYVETFRLQVPISNLSAKYLNNLAEQCSRLIASFIAKLKQGGLSGLQHKRGRASEKDIVAKLMADAGLEMTSQGVRPKETL